MNFTISGNLMPDGETTAATSAACPVANAVGLRAFSSVLDQRPRHECSRSSQRLDFYIDLVLQSVDGFRHFYYMSPFVVIIIKSINTFIFFVLKAKTGIKQSLKNTLLAIIFKMHFLQQK
ncbi:MAG: hypothetical protein WCS73_13030 [Lentisphaeria bacterium]